MVGPKVLETAFTERAGVNHVATLANRARLLWRETLMHDVGIDGHLEYVSDDGVATGRMVAVQIKSGRSFFAEGELRAPRFTPEAKHQNYWREYPHPVVIVIFHPDFDTAFWADARRPLRVGESPQISVSQVLEVASFRAILQLGGPLPERAYTYEDLASQMLRTAKSSLTGLSFLDLFLNGLADGAKSLYFGMDIYVELVRFKLGKLVITEMDHIFISQYVGFLVAYNLVRIDFDWFDQGAEVDRETGHFIGPLTEAGRKFVEYLVGKDVELGGPLHLREPGRLAVTERLIGVLRPTSQVQLEWREYMQERL